MGFYHSLIVVTGQVNGERGALARRAVNLDGSVVPEGNHYIVAGLEEIGLMLAVGCEERSIGRFDGNMSCFQV
ncbi:MAG: hypothetical protein WCI03_10445 [bacterium]